MNKNSKLQDEILRISGVNTKKCMKCGKCSGTCPAYNEMEFHPHQFASMIGADDIEPLLNSQAIYRCLTCFACVDRCPRGVQPAKLIEAVRVVALREQGKNRLKPDDIPAQLDDDTPQQLLVSAFRKYSK